VLVNPEGGERIMGTALAESVPSAEAAIFADQPEFGAEAAGCSKT
jgi:hypothetical protein